LITPIRHQLHVTHKLLSQILNDGMCATEYMSASIIYPKDPSADRVSSSVQDTTHNHWAQVCPLNFLVFPFSWPSFHGLHVCSTSHLKIPHSKCTWHATYHLTNMLTYKLQHKGIKHLHPVLISSFKPMV
jgi:hypothetical protein